MLKVSKASEVSEVLKAWNKAGAATQKLIKAEKGLLSRIDGFVSFFKLPQELRAYILQNYDKSYQGFYYKVLDDYADMLTPANSICPITDEPCDEKGSTCEPDWGGHGETPYCHLK